MYTISRYDVGGRTYRSIDSILTTTAIGENASAIVFKDGEQWEYPWRLFHLNILLGYIAYDRLSREDSVRQHEPINSHEDLSKASYLAALTMVPHDDDLEALYTTLKEMYPDWERAFNNK